MAAFQRRGPTIADINTWENGHVRRGESVCCPSRTIRAVVLAPRQFRGASALLHQRHRHSCGHAAPPNHHLPHQQWCVSCTPLLGFDSASVAHRLCRYSDAA